MLLNNLKWVRVWRGGAAAAAAAAAAVEKHERKKQQEAASQGLSQRKGKMPRGARNAFSRGGFSHFNSGRRELTRGSA